MGMRHASVDAYIAKARPFARPVLKRLRTLVHCACPAVQETLKWGFPHFDYKGMFCSTAAFKEHATFGFWKGALLSKRGTPLGRSTERAMGQFGRIRSIEDLPADRTMLLLIRRAAGLNDSGLKNPVRTPAARKARPRVPADFRAALSKNTRAMTAYREFSPGHQREYIAWITGAKRTDTRKRRIAIAVTWIAAGRTQNWKYERR
jgi:hypothetical protein